MSYDDAIELYATRAEAVPAVADVLTGVVAAPAAPAAATSATPAPATRPAPRARDASVLAVRRWDRTWLMVLSLEKPGNG